MESAFQFQKGSLVSHQTHDFKASDQTLRDDSQEKVILIQNGNNNQINNIKIIYGRPQ